MFYRTFGGLAFIALGLNTWGLISVPGVIVGILCVAAGIALLAGK